MSSRLLLPLIIAADALLAVLVGIAVPVLCTTGIWLAGDITGDWGIALAAGIGAWSLSLGGDLIVTLGLELLGGIGVTEPLSFGIGLAPLGLTLVTVFAAMRSGSRFRDGEIPLVVGLVGPLVFGVAAWGLSSVASHEIVALDALGTGILAALIYLASAAVGARVWRLIPTHIFDEFTAGWGRDGVVAMLRGSGIMALGLVTLGAFAFLIASILGLARILTIAQSLHLDVVGAIAFGLGQLALIPNGIAWAVSWLLGPGFVIGEGSSASPLATNLGPLPSVPLLGALPEGIPPVAIVLIVLPVALGVLAGLAMRLTPGADAWNFGWRRLVTPLVAAALGAVAISLFGVLAGGAIGPGRLATVGPVAGWMLLSAFATLALGALTGAFVPLAELEAAPAGANRDSWGGRDGRGTGDADGDDAYDSDVGEDTEDDDATWDGRAADDDWDDDADEYADGDSDDDWDELVDADDDDRDADQGGAGPVSWVRSRGASVLQGLLGRDRTHQDVADDRGDDEPDDVRGESRYDARDEARSRRRQTPKRTPSSRTPPSRTVPPRTARADDEPDIYADIDPYEDD